MKRQSRNVYELYFTLLYCFHQNRAGLSLLGYCYYHSQMFEPACSVYERLSSNYPEIHDYKVFYAQSLYNHGSYEDAMKVVTDLLGCELDEESKTKVTSPLYELYTI